MEHPGRAIAKVFSGAVRDLFAPYPKALSGDAAGVHDVRVAARRLRVTLALLAVHPEGKRRRRADRIVRGIARALAMSRDLDVGAELFERFLPSGEPARAAYAGLRRSLLTTRARRRRQSRERLLDSDLARLRNDLRFLRAEDSIDLDTFRARLDAWTIAGGTNVFRQMHLAGRRLRPEALHAARREARRLRYAAEIADTLLARDADAGKAWRSLQNEIGRIHDRHVFALWLDAQRMRAARAGDIARERAARSMGALVRRDALRLHREFLVGEPFGQVREALAAMRPEVAAADPRPGFLSRRAVDLARAGTGTAVPVPD